MLPFQISDAKLYNINEITKDFCNFIPFYLEVN